MRVRIAIAGAAIGTAAGVGLSRVIAWRRTWGVDPVEATKPLPGDDIVKEPSAIETRGITIDAPPEAVWPWLVQMGFGRGGWYSYDQLDMGGKSARTLVPEWSTLAVGDVMPTSPETGFEVRVIEPGRSLVLSSDTALITSQAEAARLRMETATTPPGLAASSAFLRTAPPEFAATWAFHLEPAPGGRTRLIERFRVWFGPGGPQFRVIGPLMGFGVVVMMHRQMLGIRDRAVMTAVAPSPIAPAAGDVPEAAAPKPAPRLRPSERAIEPVGRTEVIVAAS
jgi:hypothetical protein